MDANHLTNSPSSLNSYAGLWISVSFKFNSCIPAHDAKLSVDVYMHMNNASYLRFAEYSRWRIFLGTGEFDAKGYFLVAENNVQYLKPIGLFQRFTIATTIYSKGDKWLYFNHTFRHPTNNEMIFAVVEAKAVVKEPNGKNIPLVKIAEKYSWAKLALQASPPSANS